MEKEFVNYNQALKLKELGFDEPCFGFYQLEYGEIRPILVDDDEQYRLTGWRTCKNSEIPKHYTSAPTFSQAFRWFREKYNLFSSDVYDRGLNTGKMPVINSYSFRIFNLNNFEDFYGNIFNTYEESELACLDKLIEIKSE